MATRTVNIDDIDRTNEATEIGVILRLNEVTKILDLSDDHWKQLNDLLAPYLNAGTDYTPPAPAAKRKLSHDERNSLLSWGRHVAGREIKRITQEDIQLWEAYIAQRDQELLQKMDDRTTEHASEDAINAAIAAGEASTETPSEESAAPTPTTTARRGRQKA